MEAYSIARQFNQIPPIVEQAEYNMLTREKVELMMPELRTKIGLGCITWSPLSCGILSGKYMDNIPEESRANLKGYNWLREKCGFGDTVAGIGEQNASDEAVRVNSKLKILKNVCLDLECSLAQLAIAWCLRMENNSCVLLGATSVEQLEEDLGAIEVLKRLTPAHLQQIDDILCNSPMRKESASRAMVAMRPRMYSLKQ